MRLAEIIANALTCYFFKDNSVVFSVVLVATFTNNFLQLLFIVDEVMGRYNCFCFNLFKNTQLGEEILWSKEL